MGPRGPFSGRILHVLRCSVTAWLDDRAASQGAAPAFYTLVSLAPILVLVIAVAGFFYAEAAQGQLMGQLRGLLGDKGAEAVQLVLAGARNQQSGTKATIIATVLLLFGATSVFAELKDSLDGRASAWRGVTSSAARSAPPPCSSSENF